MQALFILGFKKLKQILLSLVIFSGIGLTTPAQAQSPVDVFSLSDDETARVIINLRAPEPGVEIAVRVLVVEQIQADVLETLPPTDFQLVQKFETIPGMVGHTTAQGLEMLLAHPDVESVAFDMPVEAALTESVSLLGVDSVWQQWALTGSGVNVAVLDTGVDSSHPDLADHIITQKCFSHGACAPDNSDQSDSAPDGNGHGTHIAGIITGGGQVAPRGLAPDAGIVAVKVMDDNGNGYTSDIIAALDWVVAHQAELNVSIINMSLGGGAYQGVCDTVDTNTKLYAQAAAAAQQVGITIFAAAGNQARTDALMAPACVSGVISVGATYDADLGHVDLSRCSDENARVDQLACVSNRSPELDLLAPGINIVSTALGGGQRTQSGTSMSTAHASAVAALLLQARADLSSAEIETILEETGVPVTDPVTQRVFPRIDAYAAVSRVMPQSTPISGHVLLQGREDHSGTEIFLGNENCVADTAVTTTNVDGYFEISPAQETACLLAVQNGYLAGRYVNPAGDLGTITLPGGDVNGDELIDIFDLTYIASRIDGNDPTADLVNDGLVDIFDLVIAAGNYDTLGPVSDWQE